MKNKDKKTDFKQLLGGTLLVLAVGAALYGALSLSSAMDVQGKFDKTKFVNYSTQSNKMSSSKKFEMKENDLDEQIQFALDSSGVRKQIADSNNSQRESNVWSYRNAIGNLFIDFGNPGLTNDWQNLGSSEVSLNLCENLVPEFLAEMYVDPQVGYFNDCNDYSTGYSVAITENGLEVWAPNAQLRADIRVAR